MQQEQPTAFERLQRKADYSDPREQRDLRALKSLLKGGSLGHAQIASGWSQRTLYQRGIVAKYKRIMAERQAAAETSPAKQQEAGA